MKNISVTMMYKTNNINETELVYSLLRERYPDRQIEIQYNYNDKEYKLILTDKIYIEDPNVPINVNVQVAYGDSITGDTALLLKKDDKIYIETIQSIFDESKKVEYPGFKIFDETIRLEKEYSLTDYKIWSDQGWVPIKKVIRHKCNKKIFKVLTHTGCVKVTEDHSLLDENISIIKPKECTLATKLLNSYPDKFYESCSNIVKFKIHNINNKQKNVIHNENEKWLKLKDYNNYSISNLGNVKNNNTNKLLKPKINNGYYIVNIKKNDNKYSNISIHRLVSITFLENPENKETVNHKNHNKLDNKLENLEWATMNEQNIHKRKRENTTGRKILQYDLNMNYIQSFNTVRAAGISINQEQNSTMISKVCRANLESYMNFIWKYDQEDLLENEVWKELKYNKNIFNISNYGRVKNKNGHCSYGALENSGYLRASSTIDKKITKKFVHVLVAEAFIQKHSDVKLIVNHKDCNKSNNNVNNLEWITFSENSKHSYNIKKNIVEYVLTEKEAELWGFYMKNGKLIDTYYECDVRKCKWVLYHENINKLKYFKNILESIENIKFEIIEANNNIYKLTPITNVKYLVDKYRQIFDINKKIPTEILNSNSCIITKFLNGYGIFNFTENTFEEETQIGTAGLYYLMKKLRYNVSINTRTDKEKMLRVTITKKNQRKISNKIKKIQLLDENFNDYVYDIETDIGRFQAGVGDIIVKNTDSVFLSLKYNREDFVKNRQDTFKLATICANNITEMFGRSPICLEFEKVFQPFILLTKKRYIGKKFEDTNDPFKLKQITNSGIAITRRDYCKMVKDCYREIIDCIVDDNNKNSSIQKSVEIYKRYVDQIDAYQIDFDDLVVSAMLAKSYKTRPVHVQLADKLKARNEEVQIGDRIPYIFIENDDKNLAKSELGEDPSYAKKNGLKYNRKCYLEQMAKPILGFFKVVLNKHHAELDDLIEYTNEKLEEYGGRNARLKPSDFKIES